MEQFQDRTLTCKDCGLGFIFTAGEQHFFYDKQFKNEPRRCKGCKGKRQGASPQGKVETVVKCSGCSKDTTVPFRPTQGRPVFCRECFQNRKTLTASLAPSFEESIFSVPRPVLPRTPPRRNVPPNNHDSARLITSD